MASTNQSRDIRNSSSYLVVNIVLRTVGNNCIHFIFLRSLCKKRQAYESLRSRTGQFILCHMFMIVIKDHTAESMA